MSGSEIYPMTANTIVVSVHCLLVPKVKRKSFYVSLKNKQSSVCVLRETSKKKRKKKLYEVNYKILWDGLKCEHLFE